MSAPQPIPDDELAAIKARAEAAAPGRGEHDCRRADRATRGDLAPDSPDASCDGVRSRRPTPAHIAGMDPATTLRLVAEVERLRARVATLTTELDDTAAELIGMDE